MLKHRLVDAEVKVPQTPLGDDPSGTAGQKTLRDAPVAIKRRRRFAAFLVTFLAVAKSDWPSGHPRQSFDLDLDCTPKTNTKKQPLALIF